MQTALLVTDQSSNLEPPKSSSKAGSGWDLGSDFERAVASALAKQNISASQMASTASSSFEYQNRDINVGTVSVGVLRPHRPRATAKQALEQIRAFHRRQETRRREQEEVAWIEANRRRYANRWVALLGANLLAEGESARVVSQASAGAQSTPLIIYIDESEMPFAGW